MTLAVCVPYRPGDPSRDAIWAFLLPRWQAAGLPVFTGNNPEERFSAAAARNLAATAAGDWDVALFTDADMLLDPTAVRQALALALETNGYVTAYTLLCWLDHERTRRVLAGEPARWEDAQATVGGAWMNAFAISRTLWDKLGGFNSAYWKGVGAEDVEFLHRARDLVDPARVEGEAFHLWHTPREGPIT